MKKAGKYFLYFIGFCVVLSLVYIVIGLFQGKSIGQMVDEANEEEAAKKQQMEEEYQAQKAAEDADKPADFIDDLDLDQALQLAVNNKMTLEGHLTSEHLTPEENLKDVNEVEATLQPYRDTLLYLIQKDAEDGGDYDNFRKNVYYSVDYVYQMSHALRDYLTTGDEENVTDFNKYAEEASKFIKLADQEKDG